MILFLHEVKLTIPLGDTAHVHPPNVGLSGLLRTKNDVAAIGRRRGKFSIGVVAISSAFRASFHKILFRQIHPLQQRFESRVGAQIVEYGVNF